MSNTTSSLTFAVQALNVSVIAEKALLPGEVEGDFSCDVNATVDVPISVMQELFRFQTDSIDINNAVDEDIKYAVNYTAATTDPETGVPISVLTADWISNTLCNDGDIIYQNGTQNAAETAIGYEYVRYLATKLFNTHLGVDLFSNETQLREGLDAEAKKALDNKLIALADLTYVDASSVAFEDFTHPSYSILQKIIHSDPARLVDLTPYQVDSSGNPTVFNMPLMHNDVIQFKLTVSSESTQYDIIEGTGPVPVRTYKISMVVKDPNAQ